MRGAAESAPRSAVPAPILALPHRLASGQGTEGAWAAARPPLCWAPRQPRAGRRGAAGAQGPFSAGDTGDPGPAPSGRRARARLKWLEGGGALCSPGRSGSRPGGGLLASMPLNLFPGDPGSIRPGPERGCQANREIKGRPGPFIEVELGCRALPSAKLEEGGLCRPAVQGDISPAVGERRAGPHTDLVT